MGATPLVLLTWVRDTTSLEVLVLGSVSYVFISGCSAALYLYTPEIFPTGSRALGTGIGSACARVASALAPIIVGIILSRGVLANVFTMFAAVGLAGAFLALFLFETRGKQLELISQ